MNVIDIQDNLKDFSEEQLIAEMKAPSGLAPQFLVLSEIQRRQRVRESYNKSMAENQPTVAQEVVNAAGVPQQGAMDMAQAMAPKSSMEQNTGIMTMQNMEAMPMKRGGVLEMFEGGMFGGSMFFPDIEEARRAREERANLQRMLNRSGRRVEQIPGTMSVAEQSRRINRPEYEDIYEDPDTPGYLSAVPSFVPREMDAEAGRYSDLISQIPEVVPLTDAERQLAGMQGAADALTDLDSYRELLGDAASGAYQAYQDNIITPLTGIMSGGRSFSDKPDRTDRFVDAVVGARKDIDRRVGRFSDNLSRAAQQDARRFGRLADDVAGTAKTAYGSIREGLTNRELSAPQEGDTVLQRAGRDVLGGIQSLASGIYDVAESPFRGAEEIGRYLGSPADSPEVPDAFIALDQAMARRGVRQDMERQLEMAQAVQSGSMTAEEANQALAMGAKPPVATPPSQTAPAVPATGTNAAAGVDTGGGTPTVSLPVSPSDTTRTVPSGSLEERLVELEEKRAKDRDANRYLALAQAGLTLMGSTKPTLGEAISEAGQAGIKAIQSAESSYDKDIVSLLNARAKIQAAKMKSATNPLEYLKLAQQSEKRAIDIQKLLSGTESSLIPEEQRQQLMQELIDVKNEARQYRLFGGGARIDRRVS